ncbi:MAG: TetR/AcrR family transcriptional regulator [Polyangiaceae bacterium]|nr:TetR/AcrR family transcriptional regulator [Polyangiaceae bacterium]
MARPRGDLQPRIVRAARERFLADGVDGASLRAIARGAGTGIGMVYYYFRTKDELFLAVVEETYARLLGGLEVALDPALPVEARIRRVFERFGELAGDEVDVLGLVVREALFSPTRRELVIERFSRGHIPLLAALVVDGRASGALREDVPPTVLMMSALSLGIAPQLVRRFVGDRFVFAEAPRGVALAHALAEVLMRGAAAEPRRDE